MSGFGQWLARFINDEGDLGDFARYAAADRHMPPHTISDRVTYFLWLTRHPDTANIDGRLSHPHLPTFTSAWKRYLHETVDDTSPPGPATEDAAAEHTYEALLAAMEGGTQESVEAHLSGTALDAEQRRSLISRATLVRLALAEYLISLGEQNAARYVRMSTVGFVCHTDADAAADWLVRPGFAGRRPAGPEEMAAHLADAVVACWEPERVADFIRAAATGPHAAALYPLVMVLCRRTGITVEPTSRLAAGCVNFYVGAGWENRPPHGLAVAADPREDPLLPRVLPELPLADYGVYNRLGDNDPSSGGRRLVRLLLENGLLDRDLFLRKVIQSLQQVTDEDGWIVASCHTTLFEDLQPTEEEFTACHESYARLASVALSSQMSDALTARAVGTLLREERLTADLVDRWVQAILTGDTDTSPNCAVAIGEISGSDLLRDDHIADLVHFVTGTRTIRPLHTLRALIRHAGHGRLTTDQIVACAREALTWPEEDVATALITFLRRGPEREPDSAGTVLALLADAFWHPVRAVQDQAVTLAGELRERADDTARALLATAARELEPDLRARAEALFGAAPPADETAEPSTADEPGPEGYNPPPFDMSVFDPILRILPGGAKERWLSLLRPAVTLDEGEGEGPVVGHLGGLPELPKNTPWPVWQERPLTLLASLDCALLPRTELDIPLPEDGTLLFFRFQGSDLHDEPGEFYVGYEDGGLGAGTKVLYVPASVPTRRRPAPEGREVLERVPLRLNRVKVTMPDFYDPILEDASIELSDTEGGTKAYGAVEDLMHELYGGHWAQVGGHARWYDRWEQGRVARRVLGPDATDEALRREEHALVLLASFEDRHHDNIVYWLIRREDLAARRFDQVRPVAQG
ncbi:DUF1963 domain-containing protein [Streptomyces sp. AS58]|uniref:DUF1963 domain-containing protein n=1 Tax=Streptomyces sp. AS58 TaxID=1519489 RepID=UPI0006AEF248|nr:DUF1963 domain-containing protein [Streptomyces sp. AS58]